VIPDYISAAIKTELLLTWQCKTPRPYQIEAIFHLVYSKVDMMYLIRKTGEGKSLVLQAMASVLKDVTISMVPLLGLGSDQAEKCRNANNTKMVESYHLDEFRNKNASELRDRLNEYTREEKSTIMLFVSPQQLAKHSYWYKVLLSLAERGCVSAVCFDEVHCAVHNYESFRPEFKTAIDSINELVGIARRNNPDSFYVPILAMSATFTIADQQSFNQLINRLPTIVMWGELSRRNITFTLDVSGDPYNTFIKDWTVVMVLLMKSSR
jgi:superfamily II DNA helicase RecQ